MNSHKNNSKNSTPAKPEHDGSSDLYERAVQESMNRGARASQKMDPLAHLPDPTLLPAFSSFSMTQEDHRKQTEARQSATQRESQVDMNPVLRVTDPNDKGSIISQEIENRYSSIPKGFVPNIEASGVQSDFDSPDPTAFQKKGSKNPETDFIPSERDIHEVRNGSKGLREDDGQFPSPDNDHPDDHPNPDQRDLVDRLKDKELLNSKQGQKMAQAIGLGAPGEKKVAKDFWGDEIGRASCRERVLQVV